LEVVGRKSGRITRFPLGMADLDGRWYLVSMLGDECNWVRNVRAADGWATICHGRKHTCRLIELPIEDRPVIIRQYLNQVPGARPHIPVDRSAPLMHFTNVAPRFPVFHVQFDGT
jgi:hypothetical protein